jgi:plasmid maintenance system antidote protein VapI
VTAELALKLGKLCGNGPDLWLNMQKPGTLIGPRALGDSLDAIPTLAAA